MKARTRIMTRNALMIGLIVLSVAYSAKSQVSVFSEDFEGDLSQWTGQSYGPHHGAIVSDPITPANNALSFTGLNNGGDMFSIPGVVLQLGQPYTFSVDYLGQAVANSTPDNFGGFVGLANSVEDPHTDKAWLFGTKAGYPFQREHLIDDGQWRTYSYSVTLDRLEINATDDVVHVMLEDWVSSGPSIGDVFFDNISLTLVPEPTTLVLLAVGGLAMLRRKK